MISSDRHDNTVVLHAKSTLSGKDGSEKTFPAKDHRIIPLSPTSKGQKEIRNRAQILTR